MAGIYENVYVSSALFIRTSNMTKKFQIFILMFIGTLICECRADPDLAALVEGHYFIERQMDRPLKERDRLIVKKVDPSNIKFVFHVNKKSEMGYTYESFNGMGGDALLNNNAFIFRLPPRKNDPRQCDLTFKALGNAIILGITPSKCEGWHDPTGKWVKITQAVSKSGDR